MKYFSLLIISTLISPILLFVTFGFFFFGSFVGFGITIVTQFALSIILYWKVPYFRFRFYAFVFGSPLFSGVTFWSYFVFKEGNNGFILLFSGLVIAYLIPQLSKTIVDKLEVNSNGN
jgi:hypothetical protein